MSSLHHLHREEALLLAVNFHIEQIKTQIIAHNMPHQWHFFTHFCTALKLGVPLHSTVQGCRKGEHLDNGFVSFLTCWDALQRKRNYGLTVGRGPHKGQIIRGWWSEHAAHDQERQWRWKVIKVTRREEPCKLHSQLAITPIMTSCCSIILSLLILV